MRKSYTGHWNWAKDIYEENNSFAAIPWHEKMTIHDNRRHFPLSPAQTKYSNHLSYDDDNNEYEDLHCEIHQFILCKLFIHRLDMCRRQYANDVCNRGTAGNKASPHLANFCVSFFLYFTLLPFVFFSVFYFYSFHFAKSHILTANISIKLRGI